MNQWANTVLTDKGTALLTKLTQGNTLHLTKAIIGAGYVTPGILSKQEAVADPKNTLDFRLVSYPEDGKCTITVALKNEGLAAGYEATQVGIYAMDPDEGEILFFISQAADAGSGTIVPSETEMPGYSAEWIFYLKYGQADGVSVTVDPTGTVSREEMKNYVGESISTARAEAKAETENYVTGSIATAKEEMETYVKQSFVAITNEQIDAILAE